MIERPQGASADQRAPTVASLVTLALIAAGALTVPLIYKYDLKYVSIFYEQFARIEPPALLLVALFAGAIIWLARRAGRTSGEADAPGIWDRVPQVFRDRPILVPAIAALVVFTITLVGTDVVFHRYLFSDDEYSGWFQAVIFAHGKRLAIVPPDWCRWIDAITPTSIATGGCTWQLSYSPVNSLVRAGFLALGLDRFAGPVLAVISVFLLAAVCRRAWPNRPQRMWLAVVMLAASTQFLFMSMTAYAMPTHLVFALFWLWLYVTDRWWTILLLPLVSLVALAVHSPIPHGLLVPPFLLRYLWQRRFWTAGYMFAVYGIALAYLVRHVPLATTGLAASLASPSATWAVIRSLVHVPGAVQQTATPMSISLMATWNAPVALIAVLCAFLGWRRLDTFSRDLALSFALVMIARAFMNPQGEGWGYRYAYAALGNFAILAALGMEIIAWSIGNRRTALVTTAAVAIAFVVQVPLRAVQVEKIVGPYARTQAWLGGLPAKVVILPTDRVMWGRQLIRNDPFLGKTPVIVNLWQVRESGIAALRKQFAGSVYVVAPEQLFVLGLSAAPVRFGSFVAPTK
jgi:hypothetical protein